LVVGLAASAKYPGALTALPVVVAGWRRWRALGRAAGLAVAGFALTSPFVLIHAGAAWEDISRVQRLARAGWLGFENDRIAPLAYLDRLWEAIGPLLVVALVGLVAALLRRRRVDVVLLSFVGIYWLTLMVQHAHFDRYVLPLVPPLGALAGRLRALAPVTLLLLVVPLTWTIREDRELTRTDTRVVARSWVERHVKPDTRLAVDPSLPPFSGFRIVKLDLPLPQEDHPDPDRDIRRLRLEDVRYIVVTGAVADRVLDARDDYPFESRFYERVKRLRRVFYVRKNQNGLNGPWVAVYRLQTT
jgi:hypothetical protein